MRFGILSGKTVVATLDVSPIETITDKHGEPVAYRRRSFEQMFEHAKFLARGATVYPMDVVQKNAASVIYPVTIAA